MLYQHKLLISLTLFLSGLCLVTAMPFHFSAAKRTLTEAEQRTNAARLAAGLPPLKPRKPFGTRTLGGASSQPSARPCYAGFIKVSSPSGSKQGWLAGANAIVNDQEDATKYVFDSYDQTTTIRKPGKSSEIWTARVELGRTRPVLSRHITAVNAVPYKLDGQEAYEENSIFKIAKADGRISAIWKNPTGGSLGEHTAMGVWYNNADIFFDCMHGVAGPPLAHNHTSSMTTATLQFAAIENSLCVPPKSS